MTKIISAILILALLSLLVIAAGRIIISYGCWQGRWGGLPEKLWQSSPHKSKHRLTENKYNQIYKDSSNRTAMAKHFYITATLPYVNAEPHIGFALEIIEADVLARFKKLQGWDVFFNFGTDEHGLKIYRKAQEAGKDPQKYCDEYAEKFDRLKAALNLSYNNFIRTTDQRHVEAAQKFWNICLKNGDIYKKKYSANYCVGCELEKTDSELERGRCPLHPTSELEAYDEENYFFRFSKYQPQLLKLYEKKNFLLPAEKLHEIKAFVERGLEDFSISRL